MTKQHEERLRVQTDRDEIHSHSVATASVSVCDNKRKIDTVQKCHSVPPAYAGSAVVVLAFQPTIEQETLQQQSSERTCSGRCSLTFKGCTSSSGEGGGL